MEQSKRKTTDSCTIRRVCFLLWRSAITGPKSFKLLITISFIIGWMIKNAIIRCIVPSLVFPVNNLLKQHNHRHYADKLFFDSSSLTTNGVGQAPHSHNNRSGVSGIDFVLSTFVPSGWRHPYGLGHKGEENLVPTATADYSVGVSSGGLFNMKLTIPSGLGFFA